MSRISRRSLLKSSAFLTSPLLSSSRALALQQATPLKGVIRQSVSRWPYRKIPLEEFCQACARMGLRAIDLLEAEEWEIPLKFGLVCSMGYAGGGEIGSALNRTENHDRIEKGFREFIPRAARTKVPNVITFSGNRDGMSDEEGAENCIIGLNRIKKIAEDHDVTICLELLNSKVDHPGYMADHSRWGIQVVEEVNSPRVRLLYDIYHMQIMEGDLIRTIRENIAWIAHFHTGGVPGRHELDENQEVQWPAVMRAIAETGFEGFVAHEFVPTRDPLTSLLQAVETCDVSVRI